MKTSLKLSAIEAVSDQLTAALGGNPLDSMEAVAECLRNEIFARGASTRRTVCQEVTNKLGVFVAIDRDAVRGTLDDLERCGDIASAPGGRVAATPVRLVRIAMGRYAVFSAIPTVHLSRALADCSVVSRGTQRLLTAEDAVAALEENVAARGGEILTIERWAGLDRVPPCGDEWMQQLAHRFDTGKVGPDSWESDLLDPWSAYVPDVTIPVQRRRWTSASKVGDRGSLWRSRHSGGWWVYAWSEVGPPDQHHALKLRQDDAIRTAFSLDRLAEAPLEFTWTEGKEKVLTVEGLLPRAEFRHLNVSGIQERSEMGAYLYRFPDDVWPDVAGILTLRLGVHLKQTL